MFAEPPRTRLDLRFRLYGIPVRIHPMFWVVGGALGLRLPLPELLVWVAVILVSILVHEMGHALAFRFFRRQSHVVLYSLGGITIPANIPRNQVGGRTLKGWQLAVISVCGPLAGFTLAGATYVLIPAFASTSTGVVGALYYHLVWINVVWGALNLLPVWPLDGGQVVRAALVEIAGDNGYALARLVSLVTSGAVAVVSWQMGRPLAALFFAYFAILEWQRSL
jgi:stage IV sporulation protein FB